MATNRFLPENENDVQRCWRPKLVFKLFTIAAVGVCAALKVRRVITVSDVPSECRVPDFGYLSTVLRNDT